MNSKLLNRALKPIGDQKGAVLVFVVLMFALMTIIGTSMVASSARNHGSAVVNRQSESAYYIAEAGINSMINEISKAVANYEEDNEDFDTVEAFFDEFKYVYDGYSKNYSNFEPNNGIQPQAGVIVSHISTGEKNAEYMIKSTGTVGSNKRTVSAVINVGWDRAEPPTASNPEMGLPTDTVFNTTILSGSDGGNVFGGSREINAPNSTIVIKGNQGWVIDDSAKVIIKDIYVNGNYELGGSGDANISGNIYVDGDLTISGAGKAISGNVYVTKSLFINGSGLISGDVHVGKDITVSGSGKIAGNAYAGRNVNLIGSAKIEKNAYIGGTLTMAWSTEISKDLYINSVPNLARPSNIKGSINPNTTILDVGFVSPDCIAELKPDSWYSSNGYTIKGNVTSNIPSNAKWFVNNYNNSGWQEISGSNIIVSKKDIIINGNGNFTGALIAPNGKVEFTGYGNFTGVIVSNNQIILTNGSLKLNLQSLNSFFSGSTVPINISCAGGVVHGTIPGGSGGQPGGGSSSELGDVSASVSIASPIKEE